MISKDPGDYDWLASELPPKNTKISKSRKLHWEFRPFYFCLYCSFFKWFGVYIYIYIYKNLCFCLRFFISLSLKHVPFNNLSTQKELSSSKPSFFRGWAVSLTGDNWSQFPSQMEFVRRTFAPTSLGRLNKFYGSLWTNLLIMKDS